MPGGRQRRGFLPIGEPDVIEGLGLPARRASDLRLQAAWLEAAGDALAARVRPVRIRRGVLELAVDDPAWARQVADLIPRLAVRLVRAAPGLGVRRFRVVTADGPGPARDLDLEDGDADPGDRR